MSNSAPCSICAIMGKDSINKAPELTKLIVSETYNVEIFEQFHIYNPREAYDHFLKEAVGAFRLSKGIYSLYSCVNTYAGYHFRYLIHKSGAYFTKQTIDKSAGIIYITTLVGLLKINPKAFCLGVCLGFYERMQLLIIINCPKKFIAFFKAIIGPAKFKYNELLWQQIKPILEELQTSLFTKVFEKAFEIVLIKSGLHFNPSTEKIVRLLPLFLSTYLFGISHFHLSKTWQTYIGVQAFVIRAVASWARINPTLTAISAHIVYNR